MKIKLNSDLLNFLEGVGLPNKEVSILPKDASTRTYYRSLQSKNPFILMDSSKEKKFFDKFYKYIFMAKKKRIFSSQYLS